MRTAGSDSTIAGFNRTPLTELSIDTERMLTSKLNRKMVLCCAAGYERDWRGIADLACVYHDSDFNVENPMALVLSTWIQNNPQTALFGFLMMFLGNIDRWDVLDDIQENLNSDTERYNRNQNQFEQQRYIPPRSVPVQEHNNTTMGQSLNILSFEDKECLSRFQPLPKYHACVIYAKADAKHATHILEHLGASPYNLKLFLPHRDLLFGVLFDHVELSEFMKTRCNHLIVVMTKAFLESRELIYLVNFTQKLQISENNSRRIIPILYSDMLIPATLSIYTHLDYSDPSDHGDLFDRLAKSLYDVDAPYNVASSSARSYAPTAPESASLPETPHIKLNGNKMAAQPDMPVTETTTTLKSKYIALPTQLKKKKKFNKTRSKLIRFLTRKINHLLNV